MPASSTVARYPPRLNPQTGTFRGTASAATRVYRGPVPVQGRRVGEGRHFRDDHDAVMRPARGPQRLREPGPVPDLPHPAGEPIRLGQRRRDPVHRVGEHAVGEPVQVHGVAPHIRVSSRRVVRQVHRPLCRVRGPERLLLNQLTTGTN
jgi:hypothetical protein